MCRKIRILLILLQVSSSNADDDEESDDDESDDDDEEESTADELKEQLAKPIEKVQNIAETVDNQLRDKVTLFLNRKVLI